MPRGAAPQDSQSLRSTVHHTGPPPTPAQRPSSTSSLSRATQGTTHFSSHRLFCLRGVQAINPSYQEAIEAISRPRLSSRATEANPRLFKIRKYLRGLKASEAHPPSSLQARSLPKTLPLTRSQGSFTRQTRGLLCFPASTPALAQEPLRNQLTEWPPAHPSIEVGTFPRWDPTSSRRSIFARLLALRSNRTSFLRSSHSPRRAKPATRLCPGSLGAAGAQRSARKYLRPQISSASPHSGNRAQLGGTSR